MNHPAITGPIRRIVVLRALMLGDTLCAVPALRAIRRAWPQAHISLLGLPASRELVERLDSVDEWLCFPGWPGLPEQTVNVRALPDFLAVMQAAGWDLAIQLHGSGQLSNPLVGLFGARLSAGFHAPGAWVPPLDAGLYCAWPEQGHEARRLLALCDHLGLPADDAGLEFPLRPEDDMALDGVWPGWREGGYACLHAGAQLPSRRWPVARFATVAEGLYRRGLLPVLTGTAGERPLVAHLAGLLEQRGIPHVDLAGRTSLWSLGALLRGARLLVCNDTGVSHIAAALGLPSVVVSCGSEVARWAPPDPRRHRVLAAAVPCRPCTHAVCPIGHGCALELGTDQVLAAAVALLDEPHPETLCRAACAS